MIKYYCEDGRDNCIEVFNSEKEALEYANTHNNVLEIHGFKDDNLEYLGCIWKRDGWNGFNFTE